MQSVYTAGYFTEEIHDKQLSSSVQWICINKDQFQLKQCVGNFPGILQTSLVGRGFCATSNSNQNGPTSLFHINMEACCAVGDAQSQMSLPNIKPSSSTHIDLNLSEFNEFTLYEIH